MLSYYRLAFIGILFCGLPTHASDSVKNLRKRLVSVSKQCRAQEDLFSKSEEKLHHLELEKSLKTETLNKKLAEINGYISALQRIKNASNLSFLSAKTSPQKLIQSTIVLNAFIRSILRSTEIIRQEIHTIEGLKGNIEQEKKASQKLASEYRMKFKEVSTLLKQRRQSLRKEIKERKKLEQQITKLAKKSKSLHELVQHIDDSEKSEPEAVRKKRQPADVGPNKGYYHVKPVLGPIISPYGKKHPKLDVEGCGIVFQTSKESLVYSPVNGQVVYAGPFRGYNELLILSHDTHYHTLILGMKQIDVSVGQSILAGEPVGYTGNQSPEYIYLELKKNQESVNPTPWFKDK